MTDPEKLPSGKLPESRQVDTPGPLGPEWRGEQIFPGGIQPPLPGFPAFMGVQAQIWQGSYPPPEAAERFERLQPGAFDRMLTMAEKQQEAAIAQVKQANEYRHADVKRAHLLGVLLAGAAIVAAFIVALSTRNPWMTGLFLSVPFFSVITALINSVTPKDRQPPAKPPRQQ